MKIIATAALLVTLVGISTSWASSDRVSAIVNDQIITTKQWQDTCTLTLRESQQPIPAGQRNAFCRRILSSMIDSELTRQYASRIGLDVTKAELQQAQKVAEKQGAFGKGGFAAYAKGLEDAATDKFRAELLWQKMLAQVIRPDITVTNAEVDQLINEMAKKRQVKEREISQILIAVDDPAKDKDAQAKLLEIEKKLKAGESFSSLAQAQSDDASAKKGGNMGWFATGELNPQLEEALDKMKAGEVSTPIRTPLGWHLIRLDNTRETKAISTTPEKQITLSVLGAPTPADAKQAEALRTQLNDLRKSLKSPDDVAAFIAKDDNRTALPATRTLSWDKPDNLPSSLQTIAAGLKPGEFSKVIEADGSLLIVYKIAERTSMPAELEVYREKIREHLIGNRMELGARRLIRELRQRAFVDIRE